MILKTKTKTIGDRQKCDGQQLRHEPVDIFTHIIKINNATTDGRMLLFIIF